MPCLRIILWVASAWETSLSPNRISDTCKFELTCILIGCEIERLLVVRRAFPKPGLLQKARHGWWQADFVLRVIYVAIALKPLGPVSVKLKGLQSLPKILVLWESGSNMRNLNEKTGNFS